jgi:hypothetical protein
MPRLDDIPSICTDVQRACEYAISLRNRFLVAEGITLEDAQSMRPKDRAELLLRYKNWRHVNS